MELSKLKELYLKNNHQFLILDKEGILQQSCNSLVNLDSWIGSPIYFNIPFFEALRIDIEVMKVGDRQFYSCFSFPFNERRGTYDIIIQKEIIDGTPKFICIVEDRTEQYGYWLNIQQERNESQINSELITEQSRIITEVNREITDSINYAKRIQKKILPSDETLNKLFGDYFLIYKPKDIVSGDFYWADEKDGKVFFSIADATGHGVPGAIMSVIGNSLFNDALEKQKNDKPSMILDDTRNGIIETLKQNFEPGSQFDGMDAIMCSLDYKTNTLEYSGANNSIIIITKRQDALSIEKTATRETILLKHTIQNTEYSLFEIPADKNPIALYNGNKEKFTNYKIQLTEGDRIYAYSDGFRDQFGGARIKKIGIRRFRELLLDTNNLDLDKQKGNLNIAFETWRGHNDQIDDVCVFCLKI